MDVKELGFELAHIGINEPDAAAGKETADTLCALFGSPAGRPRAATLWAGTNLRS